MEEHLIKPAGAIIRSIYIEYLIINDGQWLTALRFKDKVANTILQSRKFNVLRVFYIDHTIFINEDERVVGVRSKTCKDGSCPESHSNFEFLLWKPE